MGLKWRARRSICNFCFRVSYDEDLSAFAFSCFSETHSRTGLGSRGPVNPKPQAENPSPKPYTANSKPQNIKRVGSFRVLRCLPSVQGDSTHAKQEFGSEKSFLAYCNVLEPFTVDY